MLNLVDFYLYDARCFFFSGISYLWYFILEFTLRMRLIYANFGSFFQILDYSIGFM